MPACDDCADPSLPGPPAGDPALVEGAIPFYSDFLTDSGLRGRLLARLEGGRTDRRR
ncbi:MAG TPA: hypothetical protein VN033_06840 [Vulgatibacter sp.]|nr:hypothetical protein [Vulgatibacter sp.]